jgi:hypothetical protein
MFEEYFKFEENSPSILVDENKFKKIFWASVVLLVISISMLYFTDMKKLSWFLFGISSSCILLSMYIISWSRGKINYSGGSTRAELIEENSLLKQKNAKLKGKNILLKEELEKFVRKVN